MDWLRAGLVSRRLALGVSLGLGLLVVSGARAQMPSAAELQEMQEAMRLLQQEMGGLDPATRQQIEQLMTIPAGRARPTPARGPDPARIAALSRPLDPAALRAHVQGLQPKLTAALAAPSRDRAQRIEAALGGSGDALLRLRAAANGLAAWGAWPEATYLMGRAALAGGEVQDLNNLAAFLTMQGAGVAALPILHTLDARYPGNSTLLNNLGQAHHDLGDKAKGEAFLVAAVRRSPMHPQANVTLARLQMDRGDEPGAQESLRKALQGGFTKEKEDQLRKAGGKLRPADVRWRRPLPPDPLGLERFEPPPFPHKAMDLLVLVPQWKAFREHLRATRSALDQAAARAQAAASSMAGMMGAAMAIANSSLARKAALLLEGEGEHYEIQVKRLSPAIAAAMTADAAAREALTRRIEAIDVAGGKKYARVPGGYGYEHSCGEVLAAIDGYYAETTTVFEPLMREWLDVNRKHLNEMAFLSQYTSPGPAIFETLQLASKSGYLNLIEDPRVSLQEGLLSQRAVCFQAKAGAGGAGKLAEFDDIHCEYLSTLEMPGLGTIVSRCNVIEATLDPIFAPFKASWAKDVSKDRLLRASAAVTIEGVTVGGHSEFDAQGLASGGLSVGVTTDLADRLGTRKLKGGPLEIGVELGVTAGLEFDRGGLADVTLEAGVQSKTSSSIGKTEMAESKSAVTTGLKGSWSWNAGPRGEVGAHFDPSVF